MQVSNLEDQSLSVSLNEGKQGMRHIYKCGLFGGVHQASMLVLICISSI
jgi:hypothetical protein